MPKSLPVLDPGDLVACCPPLTAEPLTASQAAQIAPLIGDSRR